MTDVIQVWEFIKNNHPRISGAYNAMRLLTDGTTREENKEKRFTVVSIDHDARDFLRELLSIVDKAIRQEKLSTQ